MTRTAKRLIWGITGLFVLAAVLVAFLPKSDPIEVSVVSRTRESGQERVVVRLRNNSRHEYFIIAQSMAPPTGNESQRKGAGIFVSYDGAAAGQALMIAAGASTNIDLAIAPEAIKPQLKVAGFRGIGSTERFVMTCFEKLGVKYPWYDKIEKLVQVGP